MYWISLLVTILAFSLITTYNLICPTKSHWKLRSVSKCGDESKYACLANILQHHNEERCSKTRFISKGNKYVFQPDFNNALCDPLRFQPYAFFTNGSSKCVFLKTKCSEEGQVIYNNGDSSTDRSCRCNSRKYYASVDISSRSRYCTPMENDCSCYIKIKLNSTNFTDDVRVNSVLVSPTEDYSVVFYNLELPSIWNRRLTLIIVLILFLCLLLTPPSYIAIIFIWTKRYEIPYKIICKECKHYITEGRYIFEKNSTSPDKASTKYEEVAPENQILVQVCRYSDNETKYHIFTTNEANAKFDSEWSEKNVWFEGCMYKLALCKHCNQHVGWMYEQKEPSDNGKENTFYGLIIDKLVRDKDEYRCRQCKNRIAHIKSIIRKFAKDKICEKCEIEKQPRCYNVLVQVLKNVQSIIYYIVTVKKAEINLGRKEWSSSHTWFKGYAYLEASCKECGKHIGWEYRKESSGKDTFYGLIYDKIQFSEHTEASDEQ